MSLIIYMLIGAILGELIIGKFLGIKAMLIGAVIACLPEIDNLISLLMDSVSALKYSNGLTHSILILLVLPPALAIVINRIFIEKKIPMHLLTILAFWALVSNILFDLFTIHGASILLPFRYEKYSISSMSLKDYFFIIPLAIGVIILLLLQNKQILKKIIAWFYVLFILSYLGISLINKVFITSEFERALFDKNMPYTHIEAFPADHSAFAWNLVARNSDGFWESETSNFIKDSLTIRFEKRNEFFLIDYEDTKEVTFLKNHTKMWYNVSPCSEGGIYYIDLRYGKTNGVYKSYFHIDYNDNNILEVNRYH